MTTAARRGFDTAARAAPVFVAVLFVLVCAIALWRVFATIALRVPFDPNEGWNAYHALAAMSGQPLYPHPPSFMVDNYPPLSFYIVGALGRLLHDNIMAGRFLSLLSFCVVSGGLWMACRAMDIRNRAVLPGVLFFMACLLVGSDYVGMDDPELLAHALQIAALVLLLHRPRTDVAAALIFTLAIFVKHNLVALPLAVAAWRLLYDRAQGLRFVAAGAGFSLFGLVLFHVVYGDSLLSHLRTPRVYTFALMHDSVESWLAWAAAPLIVLAVTSFLYRRDRSAMLCALYAGIASLVAIAFSGGAGVDANVFFDADIALALGLALALDRFAVRAPLWSAGIAAALLVSLGSGLYAASEVDWRDPDFWLHPLGEETAETRQDIAFLRQHRGPALCETLALCYWAGKSAAVDVFNTGQAFAKGAWRDDGLIRLIASHKFASIEIDSFAPFTLTEGVRRAVVSAYQIDHTDDVGTFFVPRTVSAAGR